MIPPIVPVGEPAPRPKAGAGDPLDAVADAFETCPLPGNGPVHLAACLPGGDAPDRWPSFPAGALPASGRIATGRGLSAAAAGRGALGEAIELASVARWGDEAVIVASAAELGAAAIHPATLAGLSRSQRRGAAAWNARHAAADWRLPGLDPRRPIGWLPAREAVGGAARFVPADAVLLADGPHPPPGAVACADTAGCAAGRDLAAAALAALLEAVERDAAGRWWHGRRLRPVLGPEVLAAAPALTGHLAAAARRLRLLDLTTDIGLPVVAAVSATARGRDLAVGFAAAMSTAAAALAAVTECLAIETALADPGLAGWRRGLRWGAPPLAAAPEAAQPVDLSTGSAAKDLALALARVDARAGPVLLLDMTRRALGVPVVRAVCPALCRDRPRFGRARLLAPDPQDRAPPALRPWQRRLEL